MTQTKVLTPSANQSFFMQILFQIQGTAIIENQQKSYLLLAIESRVLEIDHRSNKTQHKMVLFNGIILHIKL